MEITGKYVETEEYKKEVEKKGFKYSPATGSLFLSYPYLPKKFSRYAVKIGLYHVGISPISKINSVEYYDQRKPRKVQAEEPSGVIIPSE